MSGKSTMTPDTKLKDLSVKPLLERSFWSRSLSGYYMRHIKTGSFRPVIHMSLLIGLTGYAIEYSAHAGE